MGSSIFDHPIRHRTNMLVNISGMDDLFTFGNEIPYGGAVTFVHEGVHFDQVSWCDVCLSGDQHEDHWIVHLNARYRPLQSPPFKTSDLGCIHDVCCDWVALVLPTSTLDVQ